MTAGAQAALVGDFGDRPRAFGLGHVLGKLHHPQRLTPEFFSEPRRKVTLHTGHILVGRFLPGNEVGLHDMAASAEIGARRIPHGRTRDDHEKEQQPTARSRKAQKHRPHSAPQIACTLPQRTVVRFDVRRFGHFRGVRLFLSHHSPWSFSVWSFSVPNNSGRHKFGCSQVDKGETRGCGIISPWRQTAFPAGAPIR